MTYKKYKILDITIFTLIICLSEAVNMFILKKKFFTANYFIPSIVTTLSMLVIIRWGAVGIIPSVIASAVHTFFAGEQGLYYLINCGGATAVAVGLLWIKYVGYKRISASAFLSILYFFSGYIAVALFRAILSVTIHPSLINNIIHYLLFDAFSCGVGIILGLIIRKQYGLMENQKDYLIRIQDEQKIREKNLDFV